MISGSNILNPSLLDPEERARLLDDHNFAQPYKHLHIRNMFDIDWITAAQKEAKASLTATFKESDLFKVFQTMDLGNMVTETHKKKLPHLFGLRNYLYSQEFRQFICDITGCEPCTDRIDLSMNIYTNGCHLLCHDDVISTRRVSFIIYLTDPPLGSQSDLSKKNLKRKKDTDQSHIWASEDGGALELYPLDSSSQIDPPIVINPPFEIQGVPTPNPTKLLLPYFNSMAIFVVQPGRSYHSVQEVYGDAPRFSLRLQIDLSTILNILTNIRIPIFTLINIRISILTIIRIFILTIIRILILTNIRIFILTNIRIFIPTNIRIFILTNIRISVAGFTVNRPRWDPIWHHSNRL
jgi:Rps23 Pro-64 3,4-dihydroxylase Tpa1-like proline 4-hydroxylase